MSRSQLSLIYRVITEGVDVETIRIVRGKPSKGIRHNPKAKDGTGRRRQARLDKTVQEEYDGLLSRIAEGFNPFNAETVWDDRVAEETDKLGDNLKKQIKIGMHDIKSAGTVQYDMNTIQYSNTASSRRETPEKLRQEVVRAVGAIDHIRDQV